MMSKIEKLQGFAVITGGTSGIGLELVKLAATDGCCILIAADRDLQTGEDAARRAGARTVEVLHADLSTSEGLDKLMETIGDRQVDILMANAAEGQGGRWLDQSWSQIESIINANITYTAKLVHIIAGRMRKVGGGRILVTGSIVGHIPGTFNLTYNSTKSFIDYFCFGLRDELQNTNVFITCLMPGATDTEFFEHADMEDTLVGQSGAKSDPAKVASDGYQALLAGEAHVVSGFMAKIQNAFAGIIPDSMLAKMHRKMAQPQN